jgi:CxxC-x17-CxxC domain-containing protein
VVFQEKTLNCIDCGKSFIFTVEEQEFFASKGYASEPKRCPACRQKRRSERFGNDGNGHTPTGPRQMFPAICARCGKETTVPFQPRGDRPVYCRECFEIIKKQQSA